MKWTKLLTHGGELILGYIENTVMCGIKGYVKVFSIIWEANCDAIHSEFVKDACLGKK